MIFPHVWDRYTYGIIFFNDRNFNWLIEIIMNNHDQKQVEVLRNSEYRYRELFDHMSSGVAVYQSGDNARDFIFADFNKAAEKIDNIDRNNLIGKSVLEVFPGVIEFGLFDVFRRVWETGKPESHPICKYHDGRITGWRENYVYKLPSGEIVAIYDDITERKQAEEKLHQWAHIFEHAEWGVVVCNVEHATIEIVNPAFARMHGYTVEDLIGYPIVDLFAPEIREDLPCHICTAHEKGHHTFRSLHIRKDGSVFPVLMDMTAVKDEFGEVLYRVVYVQDITAQVKAEKEKKRLEDQLHQAQKMEAIGILSGGIAHDFNNILSSILGFTELIKMKISDGDDIGNDLDEVLNAGLRARSLVKHLLIFSRQRTLETKVLEVSLLVKETLKFLRASLPTTVEIVQNITLPESMVVADPTQIHQILMNLCTNAVYAMKEKGGVLKVSLEDVFLNEGCMPQYKQLKQGKYIQITVSDTGHGISTEFLDRIFDPFFTLKKRGEGTGMGLSLVHGIVKDLEGAISVNSEPGKGSTFHVLLPKHEGEPDDLYVPATIQTKGHGRILFVDDEKNIVLTGRDLLERLGYEVVAAFDSHEALEVFKAGPEKFDLVLTDLTMPRMTGLELSKQLKEIKPDIPIVLCTGFSDGLTTEKIKNVGINELIMKPMIISELDAVIRKAINSEMEPVT